MRIITAIVIDGFHRGHVVRMECYPALKLLKPKVITVDYCCDMSEYTNDLDIIQYKECFRSVDGEMVLYSLTGKAMDATIMNDFFGREGTVIGYGPRTVLKMGYHNEPVIRGGDVRNGSILPVCRKAEFDNFSHA